jgi:Sugar (and other) transporter
VEAKPLQTAANLRTSFLCVFDLALRHLTAGAIAARLDRLPPTFTVWKLIILPSFGFFFELYDPLFTGNIAPGLVKSDILTPTTPGLFGSAGIASFVAALFAGLFIGAIACGFLADKYGRRAIFTYSLLWYRAAKVVMAFQSTAFGLNFRRFLSGLERDGLDGAPSFADGDRSSAVVPARRARRLRRTAAALSFRRHSRR